MHDRLVSRRIDALHQCFPVTFGVVLHEMLLYMSKCHLLKILPRMLSFNSFTDIGDDNQLLRIAQIQVRRLIMNRLICIYAV